MTDSHSAIKDQEMVVKVMHDYSYFSKNDNKDLTFKAGEEYYLIAKTSENWWYVRRRPEDPEGVYVPAQYVKEVRVKRSGSSAGQKPPVGVDARDPDFSDVKLRSKPLGRPIKQQDSVCSQLTEGVVQELNDILESLNVPEAYQDESGMQSSMSESAAGEPFSAVPKADTPERGAHEPGDKSTQRLNDDQQRVESETSDYKTDSRESLDSEGRGFEAADEPGKAGVERGESFERQTYGNLTTFGKGVREVAKKPTEKITKSESMDDYANLEEIQKAIHSRPRHGPPLADNLLPPGYCKPYKDQQTITASSKNEVPANLSPTEVPSGFAAAVPFSAPGAKSETKDQKSNDGAKEEEEEKENENSESFLPRLDAKSSFVVQPGSKRRSIFSFKKSISTSVQLVKFSNSPTTPPGSANPQISPLRTALESPPSPTPNPGAEEGSPARGDDHERRTSEMLLKPKMVDKQGPLQKAKVEESSKKLKKSWSQSYVVLCQDRLSFYKDIKSSGAKPKTVSSLGKPEFVVDLKGAKISSAPEDKNVKKDAFMLITTTKTHFILHHDDEENNDHWRRSIQNNISALQSGVVPEESGTMLRSKPEWLSTHDISESKQTIADRLRNFLLRRPSKEAIKKKGIYKEVTFGSSLASICDREKGKVPRFVKECILAIEARGLTVDGLYRVSGNVSSVQKLRSMVDHNEFYDLNQPSWDVHTITGALKLFFRELSEPLFTFKLFQPFISSLNNLNAMKDLVRQLPAPHYKTMKLLFKHLTLVLQHSRENRMQVQGLAIVFGPTLLWPENVSRDSNLAFSLVQQGQLVEFIINNSRSIFG